MRKGEGTYNLVIIGAGTAGLVTAAGAVALGARVALIERHKMGGDCLNFGCVPSKALISSARLLQRIRDAKKWGIEGAKAGDSFGTIFASMRAQRAELAPHDSVERFESLGVDVFRGEASFVSPKEVVVEGQKLRAKNFVIATGTRAALPRIEGLGDIRYFTNETIFDEVVEKPDAMLILGGGPIGCELAQAFSRLGVEVTILQHGPRLLEKEDQPVSDFARERLEADGVKVLTGAALESVAQQNGRIVARYCDCEKASHQLETDVVLIAAGRQPNVENLDLAKAGVEFGKKGVKVNACLQTTQPHIYAAGDVTGAYLFTHMADYHAAIVIRNTLVPLRLLRQKVDYSMVPWCTFLDPEIATIGLTETAAKKKGVAYELIEEKAVAVDRAVVERCTEGFIRALVARGTDKILGATIVAEHAGELIHEIALAMKCGAGLKTIAATIHAYPTFSSLVEKAGDKIVRRGLTPRVRKMTGWLYARGRTCTL